jgi:hypothetical protein
MESLLDRDEVAGHEFIYGELLIGDKGGRRKLLSAYEKMQQAVQLPHQDVVSFVQTRRLNGRGVGWLDVHLLASAIVEQMQLWTADENLSELAEELEIAFKLSQ